MKKTELVIFRPRKLKIAHSFKFKLDGKRLVPTHSVKYLGILINEHLLWNKQIAQIKMRLNRAIGMLSKLRINANFNILKTASHSLFESHLQYGTQLWGQKNNETITTFQKLQNRALMKITFKKRHDRISCVYKECKILTFPDILICKTVSLCTKSSTAPNSVPLFLLFMLKTSTTTTLDQQHTII